jgi:hypothetical protein
MERTQADHEAIQALNDEMRQGGPERAGNNKWLLTPGLIDLGPTEAAQALEAVRTFTAFDANNDPYGEHDFGAFEVADARLFWKIDYYNLTLDGGSPNPTDSSMTIRVLTVMLAWEY